MEVLTKRENPWDTCAAVSCPKQSTAYNNLEFAVAHVSIPTYLSECHYYTSNKLRPHSRFMMICHPESKRHLYRAADAVQSHSLEPRYKRCNRLPAFDIAGPVF